MSAWDVETIESFRSEYEWWDFSILVKRERSEICEGIWIEIWKSYSFSYSDLKVSGIPHRDIGFDYSATTVNVFAVLVGISCLVDAVHIYHYYAVDLFCEWVMWFWLTVCIACILSRLIIVHWFKLGCTSQNHMTHSHTYTTTILHKNCKHAPYLQCITIKKNFASKYIIF